VVVRKERERERVTETLALSCWFVLVRKRVRERNVVLVVVVHGTSDLGRGASQLDVVRMIEGERPNNIGSSLCDRFRLLLFVAHTFSLVRTESGGSAGTTIGLLAKANMYPHRRPEIARTPPFRRLLAEIALRGRREGLVPKRPPRPLHYWPSAAPPSVVVVVTTTRFAIIFLDGPLHQKKASYRIYQLMVGRRHKQQQRRCRRGVSEPTQDSLEG
jgi:hypothetical protein